MQINSIDLSFVRILLHNYDTYRQFVRDILNYWDFRPYYIDLLQGQSVH